MTEKPKTITIKRSAIGEGGYHRADGSPVFFHHVIVDDKRYHYNEKLFKIFPPNTYDSDNNLVSPFDPPNLLNRLKAYEQLGYAIADNIWPIIQAALGQRTKP